MTLLPIEKQVASLDLARRLKELGVRQAGAFYWHLAKPMNEVRWSQRPVLEREGYFLTPSAELIWTVEDARCSAFTVAELGQLISPTNIKTTWLPDDLVMVTDDDEQPETVQEATTEADARAKMLVHLIEQGVVKP